VSQSLVSVTYMYSTVVPSITVCALELCIRQFNSVRSEETKHKCCFWMAFAAFKLCCCHSCNETIQHRGNRSAQIANLKFAGNVNTS
jgi:hypothetical protein